MYGMLITYQVLMATANFSSSALADQRYSSMLACIKDERAGMQKAADIAHNVATAGQGVQVKILGAKCVKL
ncbi:MAG TPA: hypothetical protein VF748_14670 [Candidatus Acidoferrum sp.]